MATASQNQEREAASTVASAEEEKKRRATSREPNATRNRLARRAMPARRQPEWVEVSRKRRR